MARFRLRRLVFVAADSQRSLVYEPLSSAQGITLWLSQRSGRSAPLGATVEDGGVNFSLFARNATGVELVFFDREDDTKPSRMIAFDPVVNRTYHYWHAFVPAVRPGQIYAYRVSGPSDPANGLRFDPAKFLLDPYGREVVVPDGYSRAAVGRQQRRDGDEERGGGPRFVRLGGRRPIAATFRPARSSTRCTCAASRAIQTRA